MGLGSVSKGQDQHVINPINVKVYDNWSVRRRELFMSLIFIYAVDFPSRMSQAIVQNAETIAVVLV